MKWIYACIATYMSASGYNSFPCSSCMHVSTLATHLPMHASLGLVHASQPNNFCPCLQP